MKGLPEACQKGYRFAGESVLWESKEESNLNAVMSGSFTGWPD